MLGEERTARNGGSLFAPRGARCPRVTGGFRDGRPLRRPRPGARPADPPWRRRSLPRTVRKVRAERHGTRAPRRPAAVPRGGDRAGGVLGGVAEPERLRPAARVRPCMADGHGPSPRRRHRAPRGVAAAPRRGVPALGPGRPAGPGRGRRRRDRAARGTQGGSGRARRAPRRTTPGHRADVLRRPQLASQRCSHERPPPPVDPRSIRSSTPPGCGRGCGRAAGRASLPGPQHRPLLP